MDFHCRSMVGQLDCLTASSRPDVQSATHQCARFCNDPKKSHEVAVKRIIRYLCSNIDEGITLTPNRSKGFECHIDVDFAGGHEPHEAHDPQSCLSRTGYVITHANCPIVWSSKMQSVIALQVSFFQIFPFVLHFPLSDPMFPSFLNTLFPSFLTTPILLLFPETPDWVPFVLHS